MYKPALKTAAKRRRNLALGLGPGNMPAPHPEAPKERRRRRDLRSFGALAIGGNRTPGQGLGLRACAPSALFPVSIITILLSLPGAFAQEKITYDDHVRPLFRQHCLNCHNPDKAKGDLDLSTYGAMMAGSSSGEIVEAGNPNASSLYLVMAHLEEPEMPPKKAKLPDASVEVVKAWIAGGLLESSGSKAKKAKASSVSLDVTFDGNKGPENPAMPENLPTVDVPEMLRAPPVVSLAASPWAPLLAVGSHECILLFHTETLEPLGVLNFPERTPFVLRFSPSGDLLLAGGGRGAHAGRVVLFDVKNGTRVAEVGDELDVVLAADISPDQKQVALGGPSKILRIYRTDTGELEHSIKKHTDWVTSIAFGPDGSMLATGDRNGGLFVWEPELASMLFTLGNHTKHVSSLAWRPDGQLLVSASEDGNVILWGMEDGYPVRTQPIMKGTDLGGVVDLGYHRSGMFATAARNGKAQVWKVNSGKALRTLASGDDLTRVALSYDSKRAFVGDYEGQIRVVDTKSGKAVGELSAKPTR